MRKISGGYADYWNKRAETYADLDLITSKRSAYKIVDVLKSIYFSDGVSTSAILDVGCGPGIITKVIRNNFRNALVYGTDISKKMIEMAERNAVSRMVFFKDNFIRPMDSRLCDYNYYDVIIMSLMIHHLTDGKDLIALKRAFDLLRSGGKIVVVESVPPAEEEIYEEYKRIFNLKEIRNVYTTNKLISLLRFCGFEKVRYSSYRFEIRLLNWLNHKTLFSEDIKKIYNLHINSSKTFKDSYQMVSIEGGDFILNCKMAIVWGEAKKQVLD